MTNIEKYISELHQFTDSINFESNQKEEIEKFIPILKEILGLDYLDSYIMNLSTENLTLTRARKNKTKGEQFLYKNLNQVNYPSKDNVINHGRANFFYQSRFYCSDTPGTALFEVRPNHDWITTMKIKITKPKLKLLAVNLNTKYTSKGEHNFSEADIAFNKFMCEKFVEEIPKEKHFLYLPTAIITNLFIHSFDGIIYPSVASRLKGENIVLKTEIIDNYAQVIDLRVQETYDHSENGDFKVKCLYQANKTNSEGEINWNAINTCNGHNIDETIYNKKHK